MFERRSANLSIRLGALAPTGVACNAWFAPLSFSAKRNKEICSKMKALKSVSYSDRKKWIRWHSCMSTASTLKLFNTTPRHLHEARGCHLESEIVTVLRPHLPCRQTICSPRQTGLDQVHQVFRSPRAPGNKVALSPARVRAPGL